MTRQERNTREIERWSFEQYNSAWENSDGQYWDVAIIFYGEEVGTATLCYGREYEEEGPIIMNPRDSWVTDELEKVEVRQLDEEVHHLNGELYEVLRKEYPEAGAITLADGIRAILEEGGYLED